MYQTKFPSRRTLNAWLSNIITSRMHYMMDSSVQFSGSFLARHLPSRLLWTNYLQIKKNQLNGPNHYFRMRKSGLQASVAQLCRILELLWTPQCIKFLQSNYQAGRRKQSEFSELRTLDDFFFSFCSGWRIWHCLTRKLDSTHNFTTRVSQVWNPDYRLDD